MVELGTAVAVMAALLVLLGVVGWELGMLRREVQAVQRRLNRPATMAVSMCPVCGVVVQDGDRHRAYHGREPGPRHYPSGDIYPPPTPASPDGGT